MVLQSCHSDCQERICALAKNSPVIFLSVGFLRLEKINVLFVRLDFLVQVFIFSSIFALCTTPEYRNLRYPYFIQYALSIFGNHYSICAIGSYQAG